MRAILALAVALTAATIPAAYSAAAERRPDSQGSPSQPAAPAAAEGSSLGRLFYTPEQRASLDEMRRRPQRAVQEEQAAMPPAPEYVTLNGVVRRSDGTTTVWLNDKQVRGRQSEEGLRIASTKRPGTPSGVTVVIPQTGNVVDLKVGQQLDVTSGEVKERYRAPQRPAGGSTGEAPQAAAPSRDR
jgi:hypothetical protein